MITTVRVDPDDELPAILDRLPVGGSCLLVLPPHTHALSSIVGSKLLARRAESLGTRIAVVSDDRALTAHVRAAGVAVAATVEEAQRLLAQDRETPQIVRRDDVELRDDAPDDDAPDDDDADDDIHNSPTMQQPAIDPGGGNRGSGSSPAAPPMDAASNTFTFVAGEPTIVEAPSRAGGAHDRNAEAQAIRGHSGGDKGARRSGGKIVPSIAAAPRHHRSTSPAATPAAPSGGRSSERAQPRLHDARVPPELTRWIGPAALAIIGLLLLWWLFNLIFGSIFAPNATVTVQVRATTVSGSALIHAIANLPSTQQDPYHIPVHSVGQREVGTTNVPVQGTRILPGRTATGVLNLANLTTAPLPVPAGTTFASTTNVAFVTTVGVTLPAAKQAFSGVRYGTGTVPIRAAVGGSAGNVPAGSIQSVPTGFANVLRATNPRPTAGGSDVRERVVTPADQNAAASILFARLEQRAQRDIGRLYGGDLDQHPLWVARSRVIPQLSPDRKSATLTLSLVLHALYVRRSDERPAALGALAPPPGSQVLPHSLSWSSTWRPDNTILLSVTGHAAAPVDQGALSQQIKGLSKADAEAALERLGNIAYARIDLSPFWVDHLPTDVSHIHIVAEEPQ